MSPRFKLAGPFWCTVLQLLGFHAVTTPWMTVYVHPYGANDRALLRHERMHLRQIRRDGWLRFWVQYYWWLIQYGYWNNPYEIEARAAERSR